MTNLDNDGATALNATIGAFKAAGGAVVVMTHRPSAVQECDHLLILDTGQCRAFGRREDILKDLAQRQNLSLVRQGSGG